MENVKSAEKMDEKNPKQQPEIANKPNNEIVASGETTKPSVSLVNIPTKSGISKFNNFFRHLFENNEENSSSSSKQTTSSLSKSNNGNGKKNAKSGKLNDENEKNRTQITALESETNANNPLKDDQAEAKTSKSKKESCSKKTEIENASSSSRPANKKKQFNMILNRTLSDSVLERKSAVYSFNNNTNNTNIQNSKKDLLSLSRKNSYNRRSIYNQSALSSLKKNFLSTSPASPLSYSASLKPSKSGLNHYKSTCSIYNNNNNNNVNNSPTLIDSPRRHLENLEHSLSKRLVEKDSMNIKRISSLLSVSSNESPLFAKKKMNCPNPLLCPTLGKLPNENKVINLAHSPTPHQTVLNLSNSNQSPVFQSILKSNDVRRWSFASSSGYGTNTPPINNMMEENSNSNHSLQYFSNDLLTYKQKSAANESSLTSTPNSSINNKKQNDCPIEIHLQRFQYYPNSPQTPKIDYENRNHETSNMMFNFPHKRSRINSSNESSQLDDSSEAGFSPSVSFNRQRARSLSCSPAKEYNASDIIIMQNEIFKEKFPKACSQMEENLERFVEDNKVLIDVEQCQLDPAARFVHSQVIELAKLCLEKSKANQLNSDYFDEITNNLDKLIQEAKDKFLNIDTSVEHLRKLIKKFLLILSRVARLLECIEFDPLKFCSILDAADEQARHFVKTDIPKYVISKLGLNRDPFDDIHKLSLMDEPAANGKSASKLNKQTSRNNDPTPSQDDFEEIKLISNGAYGAVYLSRHKQTLERYAIKKIKKHNLVLRNQLQQVFTERDIMIFSDNPFVVALICTFETKNYLCMVMEYVEGGDVANLIKNMGPLPLDMARTYFAETTLAVEYLHNYGIIHRDLKPDNLLITSLGHIKLTDFGLSKIGLMNLTTNFYEGNNLKEFMKDHYCKEFDDKQIFGTPQYLAPEVILRQRYGKAVDWWSMGVILYEFLTSVAPFNGNTPDELFDDVLNGEIQWPEEDDELIHIPEETKCLIVGLLTHDPVKRLGANGAIEIKAHIFFANLDWDNLLIIKTDFIPQLDGPEDTSYFDSRLERYNHDMDLNVKHDIVSDPFLLTDFNNQATITQSSQSIRNKNLENKVDLADMFTKNMKLEYPNDDSNDMIINDDTDNELFASFSSCSSKFRLSSVSTTNSPVFMNESNSKSSNLISAINQSGLSSQPSEDNFAGLYINDKLVSNDQYFAEISSDDETTNKNMTVNNNELIKSHKIIISTPKATTEQEKSAANDNEEKKQKDSDKNVELNIQSKLFDVLESKLKNEQTISSSNKDNNSFKIFKRKQRKSTNSFKTNTSVSNNQDALNNLICSESVMNTENEDRSVNVMDSKNTFTPIFVSSLSNPNESKNILPTSAANIIEKNSHLSSSKRNLLTIPKKEYDYRQPQSNSFAKIQTNRENRIQNKNRLIKEMSLLSSNRPTLTIKRGYRGFGFTLRSIKVFYGKTDLYIIEHLVIQIDEQGPAFSAGLRMNDLILNVNEVLVCGKMHHEIVKLIMSSKDNLLKLRTIPLSESNIRNRVASAPYHHHHHNHTNVSNFFRPEINFSKRFNYNNQSQKAKDHPLTPTKVENNNNLFKENTNEKNTNYYFDYNVENDANSAGYPPNFNNKPGFSNPINCQLIAERKKNKKTLLRKLSEKRAQKYDFKNDPLQYRPILNSQSNSSSSSSSLNNSPSINNMSKKSSKLTPDLLSPIDAIGDKTTLSRRNMSTSDLTCVQACNENTNSNKKTNKTESSFKKFSVSNLYQPSSSTDSSSPSMTSLSKSGNEDLNGNKKPL